MAAMNQPSAGQLRRAELEQSLPLPLRGDAPGAPLVVVDVVRVAGEDRAGRGQAGGIGDPVHARPGHRDVHGARRKGGRLVERDSGHRDDRRREAGSRSSARRQASPWASGEA